MTPRLMRAPLRNALNSTTLPCALVLSAGCCVAYSRVCACGGNGSRSPTSSGPSSGGPSSPTEARWGEVVIGGSGVFDHAPNLPGESHLVILDECLFRLRTHERTHQNVPLMVPTRLLGNDLRHKFDGSDMVGPAPPLSLPCGGEFF